MFWILFFVVAAMALASLRASLRTSALVLGGAILFYGVVGHSWLWFFVLLLAWIVVLLPLSAAPLRQEWFSRPALNRLRRALSHLPRGTLDLLEAGTTWWDSELVSGAPDWQRLRDFPPPVLSAEEVSFLEGPLARHLREGTEGAFAFHLATAGLSAEIGGAGLTGALRSAALGRLATAMGVRAWRLAAPTTFAWIELLSRFGSAEQRNEWLPRLARGEWTLSAALSGVNSDRDPAAYARLVRGRWKGEEVPGLLLNLVGGVRALDAKANVFGLLVGVVREGESRERSAGDTCVLLPSDAAGLRCQNGEDGAIHLSGSGLFLPLSHIVGGPSRVGEGARLLAQVYGVGRTLASTALRAGELAPVVLSIGAASRSHAPFSRPLCEHQAASAQIGAAAAALYAADALRSFGERAVELGEMSPSIAAIGEQMGERLAAQVRASARALSPRGALRSYAGTIAGGGADSPAAALSSAELGVRILGRCHPEMRRAIEAARDSNPARALEQFDAAFWDLWGHLCANAARGWLTALGAGALRPMQGVPPTLARAMRRVQRLSAHLALLCDLTLLASRAELVARESALASLGEALSQLYLASAVIWAASHEATLEEMALVRIACNEALDAARSEMRLIIAELPSRWVRWLARLLIPPFGAWRISLRDTDSAAATRWLWEGGAARRLASILPEPVPLPLQRFRRRLALTLEGEALLARLEQEQPLPDAPAARITRALESGAITEAQAEQLRNWLEACEPATA